MQGIDHQDAGDTSHGPVANPGVFRGRTEVDFKARNKEEIYDCVNQTLQQLDYRKLKRSARGLVRRYLAEMTRLSRAQVTCLVVLYDSLSGPATQRATQRATRLSPGGHSPSRGSGRVKGVYHINAVGEVTQWQAVGAGPADQRSVLATRARC